jgi:hypothetical protein
MARETARWLARRVWLVDEGKKRQGTLWAVHDDHVLIRVDREAGMIVLPISARGSRRWDFVVADD